MPPSAFELELTSLSRWLTDTFPGAKVHIATVPAGFARPAFLLEAPRSTDPPVLPAARRRQAAVSVVYFGHLNPDPATGERPWMPLALAGRLEAALQEIRHRIPRRDAAGTQVGVLAVDVEWSQRHDSDLQITLRWRRLVPDRQPELEGETITDINYRHL